MSPVEVRDLSKAIPQKENATRDCVDRLNCMLGKLPRDHDVEVHVEARAERDTRPLRCRLVAAVVGRNGGNIILRTRHGLKSSSPTIPVSSHTDTDLVYPSYRLQMGRTRFTEEAAGKRGSHKLL